MTAFHRRPGAVSATALGVLTLTIASAHAVAPNWSHRVGLEVWRYSEYLSDHQQCCERRKELEANHERLRCQIDAGNRIATRLIERHVSLADAVDEVARINEGRSGFAMTLGFNYRDAATPQQRIARYLIDRVRSQLEEAGEASRLQEVEARLELEYRELRSEP